MSNTRRARPNQFTLAADEWNRIGERLAAVDPARYHRLLAIARGIVATYETVDDVENSADLHAALLEIAAGNQGAAN